MDTRKSIEKDMERFKVCEREMKMAGRAGVAKPTDPKEKAKDDAREWINNSVEALTAKVGTCAEAGSAKSEGVEDERKVLGSAKRDGWRSQEAATRRL